MYRMVTVDVPCFLIAVLLLSVNVFFISINEHHSYFVSRWWLLWSGVSYTFGYNCWISDKECNAYGSVWVLTVVHDAERLGVHVCAYCAVAGEWRRARQYRMLQWWRPNLILPPSSVFIQMLWHLCWVQYVELISVLGLAPSNRPTYFQTVLFCLIAEQESVSAGYFCNTNEKIWNSSMYITKTIHHHHHQKLILPPWLRQKWVEPKYYTW